MFDLRLDSEIRIHRFRPPCPRCRRRTWPASGLDNLLIFRCLIHGYWLPDPIENDQGDPLPIFRWRIYDWRFP